MIIMYSKSNCSYCAHAREYMNKNNIPYTEFKLDEDFNRDFILHRYPEAKTYPIIVDKEEYIGGFIDLKSRYDNKVKYLDEGEWNGS
jgi:glutaredoxin